MEKQILITVSREYGSGGHVIAEKIAKDFGLKLYDRSMLDEIANEKNIHVDVLEEYDEKPRNKMLTRRVGVHSNSMEEIVADMQFDFIREKAESGESFVVVGRCAETVLRRFDGLINIFITGDKASKQKQIEEIYHLTKSEAAEKIKRHDKKRKRYHDRHSDFKWGDSRHYDLCINSSKLGLEKTGDILEEYIKARIN